MTRLLPFLIALVLLAGVAEAQPVQPGTRLDGIAAVVGDQVILTSEVEAYAQQAAQGQPVTDVLRSRALDQIVNQRILIAAARRDTTVRVQESELERAVNEQVSTLAGQAGGEDALVEAYDRPIEELRLTFRDDIRDEIMLTRFRERRLREVTVTPTEVREWFARIPAADIPEVPEIVRVAHIVKKPAPNEAAVTRTRQALVALRDSVVSGQATIEAIAGRHSQDPGSVRNGGRYDGFALRQLNPPFAAAAAALQPGEVSQVFQAQYPSGAGFHFLRLNSRQGETVSFNHVLLFVEDDGSGTADARRELAVLRDSIVTHGVPFEALARRVSEDPYSASRGGFVSDPRSRERDLRLEGLGPLWKATIDTLAVGEISRPAEVTLLDAEQTKAVHIVWLQKRTPAHTLSVADDYALLSQYALQEKRARVLSDWIRDLRTSVYVDVRDPRYQPATQS